MAVRPFLIPSLMAVAFLVPFGAQAFECPKHLTAAQAAIDKVVGDMKGMKMAQADRVLVHALLDDAKMSDPLRDLAGGALSLLNAR